MFQVWQSVQVINENHPRKGQAGTVFAVNKDKPDEVVVKFDLDGEQQAVQVADLKGL